MLEFIAFFINDIGLFLCNQIDRIMEKFAERFTTQNPEVFPTADAAFILAFSIIMLNTDLHNPAIKEERRMTKEGFVRNNSGICNGEDLPADFLHAVFDRIKASPISLKEDDDARDKTQGGAVGTEKAVSGGTGLLFSSPYTEIDRKRENDYQKERDEILRNTESLFRRKKKGQKSSTAANKSNELGDFVRTIESGLKDEYVIPMFDVTWGPALAVFSTVMESANGTMGVLLSIASDKEIELAALNAASSTEVCLSGFQLAIRIAALCGNNTARSAYVHALSNFSCLGTGRLLEHRHIRCVQTLLEIARDDGELLGSSWEYVFKALSEVARLNRLHEAMVKANRAHAAFIAKQKRKAEEVAKRKSTEEKGGESSTEDKTNNDSSSAAPDEESVNSILYDSIEDDFLGFEEEGMDSRAIDENNARIINESMGEDLNDAIYNRSSALSTAAVKDFMFQLCRVSRMEISGYGGHVGSKANDVDLTAVHYRQHHTLLTSSEGRVESRNNQPDIYSLQKLVEVTHYNMDLRPRLVFSDIWSMVSGHLTSTALHSNAAVAIYAVDSFRQLSIQFLKREELGVFEFQRNFLKPYEVVMTQCKNESVKEFLLKAVEQIILLFGSQEEQVYGTPSPKGTHGSLRSGWRPLMTVIGLSSNDTSSNIANLGFKMLTSQLQQSLSIKMISERMQGKESSNTSTPKLKSIRADRFVDLVDSLLMFVSGSREDMSAISIDHLVTLSQYLADKSIPLPEKAKTPISMRPASVNESSESSELNSELELWWPILLGLSRSVGDTRPNIRIKSLITLLAIINEHFFSCQGGSTGGEKDLQVLQLIFRGVLIPTLEHAETSLATTGGRRSSLPDGFIRFMTRGPSVVGQSGGGRKDRIEVDSDSGTLSRGNNWLDTTFDHLMDGSIALLLKSIKLYNDDVLIEEILAMFNTCLISDSGSLAVRGLKKLNQFIINDLGPDLITDDTWATFCHMLRRCLAVRGLLFNTDDIEDGKSGDNADMIQEFIQEESILSQRRYIGSTATMVIGSLLSDKQFVQSMGMRWYLFLFSGLGAGIKTWEKAASIMTEHSVPISISNEEEGSP